MLIIAVPAAQIGLIAIGAVAGLLLCRTGTGDPISNVGWTPSPRTGIACLAIFTAFLVVLPVLASTAPALRLSNIFYRAGSLVFGGGHVVLPRSEEHTSELQSLMRISYDVLCLKKKQIT